MAARIDGFSFASGDGTTSLHGMRWAPAAPGGGFSGERPRGIVQLVHGMSEHISRYDAFARFLADRGYVVVGHDQIGHGGSSTPERYGCLPAATGKDILLQDIETLRGLAMERYGETVPYFLFGHSMGSFLVRIYVSHNGSGLAGAVVCGTGSLPPATSAAGHLLAELVCRTRGEDYHSRLLHDLADGAYAKAVPDAETPFDWLSYNRDNVRAYIEDPACGFMFSAGGYAVLTELTRDACSEATAKAVPKDLPLYFIGGEDDPVGDMGRGVQRAFRQAVAAGSRHVRIRLWPHMRHEILMEDGREQVFADVVHWMEEQL